MEYDTFVIQLCVMTGKQANRPEIDHGGKCILPQYVFQEISARRTPYPIMFELFFPHNGKSTHLGVLEFTASEGTAIVPEWVLEKFHARRLAHVQFRTVSLPMGNFIRIRPMQRAFVEDLSNPKMVLENALHRNFVALSTGDTFAIGYQEQTYKIHVMEVRSRQYGKCPAVKFASENMDAWTELIVEFERPADMPASPNHAHSTQFPATGGATTGGNGNKTGGGGIDFNPVTAPSSFVNSVAPGVGQNTNPTFVDNTGKKFEAFVGDGKTISGKTTGNTTGGGGKALGGGAGGVSSGASAEDAAKAMRAARAAAVGRTISGKTVALKSPEEIEAERKAKEEEEEKLKKEKEAAGVAFSGQGRALGGNSNRPPPFKIANNNNEDDAGMGKPQKSGPIIGKTLRGNTVNIVPNPDDDDINAGSHSSSTNQGGKGSPVSPQTPGIGHAQQAPPGQAEPHKNSHGGTKDDDEDKFQPFRGAGRKLAGK